jgi:hypothetical protein
MRPYSRRSFLVGCSCLVCGLQFLSPSPASAQFPYPTPMAPDAQRNMSMQVRSEIGLLQNTTRTAPSYGEQGYGQVWEHFQTVRGAYSAFKQVLNPSQLAEGANALAELDAGLDIIQGAFDNFQTDVAAGRPVNAALRDMCQVLRESSQVWLQEFNKTCSRLRTSWH